MSPFNKERSPYTDDKSGGAIATSERGFLYPMGDDLASAWLRLSYAATRLIQIPFGFVFWALEQRCDHLEIKMLSRDQADD